MVDRSQRLDKEDFTENEFDQEPEESVEEPSDLLEEDEESEEDPVERDLRISQARQTANMMALTERFGTNKRAPIKRSETITPKVDPRDSFVQQYARENVDLKAKIKTLEGMVRDLRSPLKQNQSLSSSNRTSSQEKVDNTAYNQLKEQLKDLEEKIEGFEETIKNNDEENAKLRNSLGKANRRCQDCRELEQLDDLLKKERKEHSDERSQWINDKKNLERESEQVKKDKEKLVGELKGIKEELTRLRASLNQDSESVKLAQKPQNPTVNMSREQTDSCVTTIFSFSFNQG